MESLTMYLKNCLSVFHVRKKSESLYPRLLRYLDEAYRDELIGDGRYAVALGKTKKLQRFLIIKGRPSLPASAFTADMVLEFRRFIQDEYKYVSQHPELYPRGGGHRPPQKRFRNTTVVHDLKLLQAFFTELENTGEIRCSPFRKIPVCALHPVVMKRKIYQQLLDWKEKRNSGCLQ